jgi:hypothetical protein
MEEDDISSEHKKMECMVSHKLHKALKPKEETWRLNSRSLWLRSRERNTSFFHRQAKVRMLKNNVKEITLEDGSKLSNFLEIKEAYKVHYETL